MSFIPPSAEQLFAINVSAGIAELARNERFVAVSPDLVAAIVEGIGAFAQGHFAPLNRIGDQQGAKILDGVVTLPEGLKPAYQAYIADGWNAVAAPAAYGGQGLPFTLACCVLECLGTANLAFTLLPMLTVGAIEALNHHGSEAQKALYLPKLISGEWPGTMNLTEPQAGSDVGALRTTATPITAKDSGDGPDQGKYLIEGTKIFITWGEHDLAENIVHLVLARTPKAPEGSRGISLFLVSKFHVNADGTLGTHNDVHALSIEHKLGLHASPTCMMRYGEDGKCIGELIGHENGGLKAMFTMMNSARINVGNQGLQIAEAAWQKAAAFSRERVQSARAGSPDKTPVAIVEHPDVRRMLLRMRALTEGARGLLYYTAGQVDRGTLGDATAQARADLLVPLLKAWGTDIGLEVTHIGLQIHGGMGFIEETGAGQYLRDACVLPIYEGTNGIQAADLVTRKLGMVNGAVLQSLMAEIVADAMAQQVTGLAELAKACADIGEWMRDTASLDDRLAGAVPYCTMCAVAVAGWQLLRQAAAAKAADTPAAIARSKPVVARFFNSQITAEALGLKSAAMAGAEVFYALDAEALTA